MESSDQPGNTRFFTSPGFDQHIDEPGGRVKTPTKAGPFEKSRLVANQSYQLVFDSRSAFNANYGQSQNCTSKDSDQLHRKGRNSVTKFRIFFFHRR